MSVTTGSASNIKKLNRIRAICMVGLGHLSKPFVKAFPFIVPQRGKAFVNNICNLLCPFWLVYLVLKVDNQNGCFMGNISIRTKLSIHVSRFPS